MFDSVDDVQGRFRDAKYIANRRISTVVYLAARMGPWLHLISEEHPCERGLK